MWGWDFWDLHGALSSDTITTLWAGLETAAWATLRGQHKLFHLPFFFPVLSIFLYFSLFSFNMRVFFKFLCGRGKRQISYLWIISCQKFCARKTSWKAVRSCYEPQYWSNITWILAITLALAAARRSTRLPCVQSCPLCLPVPFQQVCVLHLLSPEWPGVNENRKYSGFDKGICTPSQQPVSWHCRVIHPESILHCRVQTTETNIKKTPNIKSQETGF